MVHFWRTTWRGRAHYEGWYDKITSQQKSKSIVMSNLSPCCEYPGMRGNCLALTLSRAHQRYHCISRQNQEKISSDIAQTLANTPRPSSDIRQDFQVSMRIFKYIQATSDVYQCLQTSSGTLDICRYLRASDNVSYEFTEYLLIRWHMPRTSPPPGVFMGPAGFPKSWPGRTEYRAAGRPRRLRVLVMYEFWNLECIRHPCSCEKGGRSQQGLSHKVFSSYCTELIHKSSGSVLLLPYSCEGFFLPLTCLIFFLSLFT